MTFWRKFTPIMKNNLSESVQNSFWKANPWLVILVSFLLAFGFLLVGTGLIMSILATLLKDQVDQSEQAMAAVQQLIMSSSRYKEELLSLQAVSALFGFIVGPLIAVKWIMKERLSGFWNLGKIKLEVFIGVILLIIAFMGINSYFIAWNESMVLPDMFAGLEKFFQEKEQQAADMTKILTEMDTTLYFIVALLVIAVLPGIGEEFLFRGVLQNQIFRISGNVHLSIWMAAAVFSAIHVQFYGFIPRMLLGALFGYLYVWTGSFWVAAIAHATNNGVSLLLMYAYQKEITDVDIESAEPSLAMGALSLVLVTGLLYFIYQKSGANESRRVAKSV